MKTFITLIFIFLTMAAHAAKIDEIKIYKSKRKMYMYSEGKLVKTYKVMLGRGGSAPKRQRGDNRVPEGEYIIDYKNPESLFYKSLHISYPNEEDKRRAAERGVDPGGDIMIHGYPNHPKPFFRFLRRVGLIKLFNWTAGCAAVSDQEMEDIYNNVEVLTPVTIFH